jgi:ABC-type multidrug transport system ATPase subunit
MATKKVQQVDLSGNAVEGLDKDTFREMIQVLRRIVKNTDVLATQDINQRQRVVVEAAVVSSGTISTVGTVSNVNTLANVDARFLLIDTARTAYANGIRNKIIF